MFVVIVTVCSRDCYGDDGGDDDDDYDDYRQY